MPADFDYLARLQDYYALHRAPPSLSSISQLVGLRSKSSVAALAKRLMLAGYLSTTPDRRLAPTEEFFARAVVDSVRAGAAAGGQRSAPGIAGHRPLSGVKKIYRPGFAYQKAGVQVDLFARTRDNMRLMQTMDRINVICGRDTLYLAAAGIQNEWRMKRGEIRRATRPAGVSCPWRGDEAHTDLNALRAICGARLNRVPA